MGFCRECHVKRTTATARSNKDRYRAYRQDYRRRNSDKRNESSAAWRNANPDRVKALIAQSNRATVDELRDSYVAHCLELSVEAARPLIEAKRLQLKISRILKEANQ